MKTVFATLVLSGIMFAAPLVGNPIAFRIDSNHSNIGFAVPISGGFSSVHGKFGKFKMDLSYDESDITKSTVNVAIDAASVSTGISQRDAHLRTADFFDVKNHPEITFKSKRVEKKGEQIILTGDFQMRGITKEISFPVEIVGKGTNKDKTRTWMGFRGRLSIDRTEYNVSYQHQAVPGFIGNKVDIYLNILTRSAKIN